MAELINMKQQIVIIGGGGSFRTYKEYINYLKHKKLALKELRITKGWKDNLDKDLGKNFEVIKLKMPNATSAKYIEWKIIFKKLIPLLKNNVILLGHSLGAIFLAKYLSENKFPKKIKATILVSAPFDDGTVNNFKLPNNLDKFKKQGGKIFLYHSKDDKVVPSEDLKKYKNKLTTAKIVAFKNRGHFEQSRFYELIKNIKSLY